MKRIYQITIILICCLCCVSTSFAQQESLRDRLAKKQQQEQKGQAADSSIPRLSVRAEMMNENQKQDLTNATWIREIYRELDLKKGTNAALNYPVQPIGDRVNLYTLIFKLMAEGSLSGYRWNDGQDLFVDNMKVNFEDILKNLEIPYQKSGDVFTFDEFSIPGNEVTGYYIKEVWYFDQSNSVLDVKVSAICPILSRQEYFDDVDMSSGNRAFRYPQFWINYEDIQPYTARMPIMVSDMNNVMSKTVDDYFKLRLYDGEIYKTTNMENLFLSQKFKTPEELKYAQDSIEKQLKQFDKKLWVANDSVTSQNNKKSKVKTSKTKTPKSSSSGGTTYSARDRR